MKPHHRRRSGGLLALLIAVPLTLAGAVLIPAWLKPGYVECPGYLEPDTWTPLYAPADGIVIRGELLDGSLFTAGDVVLELDDVWHRWNLERIRRERAVRSAEMESLRIQIDLFRRHRDIEAGELLRLLETDRLLEASSSLSRNEREHSEFLYRSYLAGAEREEALLRDSLSEAVSSITALDGDERLWKERLADCRLATPVSGVFYSTESVFSGTDAAFMPPVGPGRSLEAGRLLGYVIPEGPMAARIDIPQRKVARCRPGQPVLLSLAARPHWSHPPIRGQLTEVSSLASGGGFHATVEILPASIGSGDDLGVFSCGDLTARIDVRGVRSDTWPARAWERWVVLANGLVGPPPGDRRNGS